MTALLVLFKERPNSYDLEFMGTSMCYIYNTYKIASQSDELRQASNNPFALVVLTAKAAMQGRDIKDASQRDETYPLSGKI